MKHFTETPDGEITVLRTNLLKTLNFLTNASLKVKLLATPTVLRAKILLFLIKNCVVKIVFEYKLILFCVKIMA